MLHDEMLDEDGLDDHDRSRASDMEDRPIYPATVLLGNDPPIEEEAIPEEQEA